jgi:integrase
LIALGNWLHRSPENPFWDVPRVNAQHRRRPLPADEFARVLAAAATGKTHRRTTGPDRRMEYLTGSLIGLQASELASLSSGSFSLDGTPPTVTVAATYFKHRREVVVPLHPEPVTELRDTAAAVARIASPVGPTLPDPGVAAGDEEEDS